MQKAKWYYTAVYTAFLIFSFFYVRHVLAGGGVSVNTQKEQPAGEKTRLVDIVLTVETPSKPVVIKTKFKNTNSVEDMLYELRNDDKIFYEVTTYTYGAEIDEVMHIKAPAGYKWRIFEDKTDVTNNYSNVMLKNDVPYTIKLVKQ